jgi:translation elongation factor EF-1beta
LISVHFTHFFNIKLNVVIAGKDREKFGMDEMGGELRGVRGVNELGVRGVKG